MGERCILYYIHKILMRERERELNSMRNIIRIVFANCLAYFSYFLFFLFSHSYKLVKYTHIHPHTHTHIDTPINTHTHTRMSVQLSPKASIAHCSLKSIWFVCFFYGATNTTQSGSRPSKSFPWGKERKHTENLAKESDKKRKTKPNPRWEYSRTEKVSMNIFIFIIDCKSIH